MKQIARPNRVSYDAARLSALVIRTRGDGHLGDTSPAEVTQIAAQVAETAGLSPSGTFPRHKNPANSPVWEPDKRLTDLVDHVSGQ